MLNEVVLVGAVEEVENMDNKCEMVVRVDRPFKEEDVIHQDYFRCKLWKGIFDKTVRYCSRGDIMAIRGRIVNENDNYLVMVERLVLLNKSNNNTLKRV